MAIDHVEQDLGILGIKEREVAGAWAELYGAADAFRHSVCPEAQPDLEPVSDQTERTGRGLALMERCVGATLGDFERAGSIGERDRSGAVRSPVGGHEVGEAL